MKWMLLCLFLWGSAFGQSITIIPPKTDLQEKLAVLLESDSGRTERMSQYLQQEGYWLHQHRKNGDSLVIILGPKLALGRISGPSREFLAADSSSMDSNNLAVAAQFLLQPLENSGYPFAQLVLDSYQIEEGRLNAEVRIDSGPRMTIDSIITLGYQKFSTVVLAYDLEYRPGQPYRQKWIDQLERRLSQRGQIKSTRPPALAFYPSSAHLYLYLEKEKSNLISGLIGLNTDNEGRARLTGNFDLSLNNNWNRGERIELQWQNPQSASQDLRLSFSLPFWFGSPLSSEFQLRLFRQDSSFSRQDIDLSLPYNFGPETALSAQFAGRISQRIGNSDLLEINDFRTWQFGLGFDRDTRERQLVPRQGYLLSLALYSGFRARNEQRIQQYRARMLGELNTPFSGNWNWSNQWKAEWLSGERLSNNELFRLGGINDLRGYNEMAFFSQAYGLWRSELRYHLGSLDYLALFSDLAYQENPNSSSQNWLHGLGAGFSFQTKGGIFTLFFAVGQEEAVGYDFRQTKVHLSYLNRF